MPILLIMKLGKSTTKEGDIKPLPPDIESKKLHIPILSKQNKSLANEEKLELNL